MEENSGRHLRNLIVVVPLVLLFVAVALDQDYGWTNALPAGSGAIAHPSNTPALQMIGYSYESGPALLDITLANVGTQPITILNVTYDNQTLASRPVGRLDAYVRNGPWHIDATKHVRPGH